MSTTIGQQLRQARQERDIPLEQVAHATHIRLHYLQAIEAGDLDRLPSPVQARGFLRAYASYLGLDPELLLLSINGERRPDAVPAQPPDQGGDEVAAAPSPRHSGEILAEIGEQLQRQRELLGLSLEDVERHTHLRVFYLRALESGRLQDLPSSVQGRGMLKNYAEFLVLDPEPVLLRFADALQTRLSERQPSRPRAPAAQRSRRSYRALLTGFPGDFLLGGFLLLLLAGFVVWGAIRISTLRSAAAPLPTIPSVADELLTSAETQSLPTGAIISTPSPAAAADSNTSTPPLETPQILDTEQLEPGSDQETPPPSDLTKLVNVSLAVRQRAWVRVTVDGEIEFEGRMLPGSAYTFSGNEEVSVLTGNGAALQVFFNDQDLGTMGIYGEVVERVFTPEGLVLPTPTITPTPTATPTEMATPEVTITSQPTTQP